MTLTSLIVVTLALTFLSFVYGRRKAVAVAGNQGLSNMHSLPSHYGMMVALWCALPALAIIVVWKLIEPTAVNNLLNDAIPLNIQQAGDKSVELYRNELGNILNSGDIAAVSDPEKQFAAQRLSDLRQTSLYALIVLVLAAACAGAALALKRIKPDT